MPLYSSVSNFLKCIQKLAEIYLTLNIISVNIYRQTSSSYLIPSQTYYIFIISRATQCTRKMVEFEFLGTAFALTALHSEFLMASIDYTITQWYFIWVCYGRQRGREGGGVSCLSLLLNVTWDSQAAAAAFWIATSHRISPSRDPTATNKNLQFPVSP